MPKKGVRSSVWLWAVCSAGLLVPHYVMLEKESVWTFLTQSAGVWSEADTGCWRKSHGALICLHRNIYNSPHRQLHNVCSMPLVRYVHVYVFVMYMHMYVYRCIRVFRFMCMCSHTHIRAKRKMLDFLLYDSLPFSLAIIPAVFLSLFLQSKDIILWGWMWCDSSQYLWEK